MEELLEAMTAAHGECDRSGRDGRLRYAQTFDELIRQVTVNCAERGLLLLRVRDEIRMTIAFHLIQLSTDLLHATKLRFKVEAIVNASFHLSFQQVQILL